MQTMLSGGVVAPTLEVMDLEEASSWLGDVTVTRIRQTRAGVVGEGFHDTLGQIAWVQTWHEVVLITA